MFKSFSKAISFYLALPFIYFFSILPMSWLYGLSKLIFLLMYQLLKYRRRVVFNNLKNSFPEKSIAEIQKIERDFYKILSDYIVESIKSFTAGKSLILSMGRIVPNAEFEALAKDQKNIIISAGHVVNQEIVNLFLSASEQFPYHVKAAYHSLANPYFDRFFFRSRTRFGSGMYSMKESYKAIEQQEYMRPFAFFLLNDQSAPPKRAYWARFLNQDTSFYKGMAVFAQKYDMPVFYAHVRRPKRGYFEIEFIKISDRPGSLSEAQILEPHVKLLEQNILEDPQIWLWSHKRWKHSKPI